MKTIQSKTVLAYERVLGFLVTYASLLGTIPQLAAVATLTRLVGSLNAGASTQDASGPTKGGITNQIKAMRAALIATMRTIAAIATDASSTIPAMPTLKSPPSNITSAALVAGANGMAEAAEPFADTFVAAGLLPSFVMDLSTAAANLNTALATQGATKGKRVNATQTVATALQQARRQLNIINPRVEQTLAGNVPVLKEWKQIKRVAPKAPTSSSTVTPVVPTPMPTPTPVSTQEVKAA